MRHCHRSGLLKIPALLLIAGLLADAVATEPCRFQLKDGTVMTGSVVAEDDNTYTIAFEMPGGISGQTRFNKSSVVRKEPIPPDEVDFGRIRRLDPEAPSSYSSHEYAGAIRSLKEFLEKHPQSARAGEARNLMRRLEADQNRVSLGWIRSGGEWITPDKVDSFSYDIEANKVFDRFQQELQRGNTGRATELFGILETKYPQSTAYARAAGRMIQLHQKQLSEIAAGQAHNKAEIAALERSRKEAALQLGDAQSRLSSAPPAGKSRAQNQVNSAEARLAKVQAEIDAVAKRDKDLSERTLQINAQIKALTAQGFTAGGAGADFEMIEEKLSEGKIAEVRRLLDAPEYKRYARTASLRRKLDQHDQWISKIKGALAAQKLDDAQNMLASAEREFPGSEQLEQLQEQLREARRKAAR